MISRHVGKYQVPICSDYDIKIPQIKCRIHRQYCVLLSIQCKIATGHLSSSQSTTHACSHWFWSSNNDSNKVLCSAFAFTFLALAHYSKQRILFFTIKGSCDSSVPCLKFDTCWWFRGNAPALGAKASPPHKDDASQTANLGVKSWAMFFSFCSVLGIFQIKFSFFFWVSMWTQRNRVFLIIKCVLH